MSRVDQYGWVGWPMSSPSEHKDTIIHYITLLQMDSGDRTQDLIIAQQELDCLDCILIPNIAKLGLNPDLPALVSEMLNSLVCTIVPAGN